MGWPRPLTRLILCAAALVAGAGPAGAAVPVDTTVLVSRPPGFAPFTLSGGLGAADLTEAGRDLSSDGRYVVFRSDARGLDTSVEQDVYVHCYLRDTVAETTVMLDRRPGSATGGAGTCSTPTISGDGSAVAFVTGADLGVPGDVPRRLDVVVWDRGELYALGAPGPLAGGWVPTFFPDVTVTGTGADRTVHVAFTTVGELVPEDANGMPDLYVRSFGGRPGIDLVSRAAGAGTPAVGATNGTISGDGTRVAFVTTESLDAADTGTDEDVYLRDLGSGSVTYVSRPTGTGGEQTSQYRYARTEISRDGSAVAFTTNATNLGGTGLFNIKGSIPINRVHVRRLGTNTTLPMAVANGSSTALSQGETADFAISDDGTRVAFTAHTYAAGNGSSGWVAGSQVYVRVVGSTTTTPIVPTERFPGGPIGFAGDGTRLLYARPDPTRGNYVQVFLRDLSDGSDLRVSAPKGPADAPLRTYQGGSSTAAAGRSVSADGRYVVFTSANDVLAGGTTAAAQVYLRDTETGETRLLSAPAGEVASTSPVISADGGVVAFQTASEGLGATDARPVVVVWRRADGGLRTITAPSGTAEHPRLTADGGSVVFLASGDPQSAVPGQIWIAATDTGAASPLIDTAVVPAGERVIATSPVVSGDGTRVAFSTDARLETGDIDTWTDVYVLDRASGRVIRASAPGEVRPDASVSHSGATALSRDGSVVAYLNTQAGDAFGMFTNGVVRRVADGALLPPGASGPTFTQSGVVLLSDDGTRAAATVMPEGLPPEWDSAAPLAVVRSLTTGVFTAVSRGDGARGVLVAMEQGASLGGDPALDHVAFTAAADVAGTPYGRGATTDVYLRRAFGPPPVVPGSRRTLTRVSVPRRVIAGRRPALRFTLGTAGPVRLTVQRARAGRFSGGRCRVTARTGRSCTAWTTVQTRRVTGRAGANVVRLAPRRIAGRYRVRLAVTGGPTRVIPFRVVRTGAT